MTWNRYNKVPHEVWMRQVEAMNHARAEKHKCESTPRQDLMPDQIIELPRQVIVIDHQISKIIYGDFFKKRRSNSYVLAINGNPCHSSIGFARGMREIAKELPAMSSPSVFY